jgi:hypothetical protein
MNKFFTLLFFFVSSSVFGSTNTYDLKMDLSVLGRHVASPRLTVKEGMTASITQQNEGSSEVTFVDIISVEKKTDHNSKILMNFSIGTISLAGERTVLTSGKVITSDDGKARVSSYSNGNEQFSLDILATKKVIK